jgi:hypothetical protein
MKQLILVRDKDEQLEGETRRVSRAIAEGLRGLRLEVIVETPDV